MNLKEMTEGTLYPFWYDVMVKYALIEVIEEIVNVLEYIE